MGKTREQIFEELLVLRAQNGDAAAFRQLVDRWQERLWRYAKHGTGDTEAAWDVVQETWAGAIKGLRNLHDPATFPKWIYRILENKCVDWTRRQAHRRQLDERLKAEAAERQDAPPATDENEALARAIAQLPGDTQRLLTLRYLDEMSTVEIAEILGVPEGTVKSRLHHARARLREALERQDHG